MELLDVESIGSASQESRHLARKWCFVYLVDIWFIECLCVHNSRTKPQIVNAAGSVARHSVPEISNASCKLSSSSFILWSYHSMCRHALLQRICGSLNLEGSLQVFNAGTMQCCAIRWFKNADWKPIIQGRTRGKRIASYVNPTPCEGHSTSVLVSRGFLLSAKYFSHGG